MRIKIIKILQNLPRKVSEGLKTGLKQDFCELKKRGLHNPAFRGYVTRLHRVILQDLMQKLAKSSGRL
jgi:hypothetical protein